MEHQKDDEKTKLLKWFTTKPTPWLQFGIFTCPCTRYFSEHIMTRLYQEPWLNPYEDHCRCVDCVDVMGQKVELAMLLAMLLATLLGRMQTMGNQNWPSCGKKGLQLDHPFFEDGYCSWGLYNCGGLDHGICRLLHILYGGQGKQAGEELAQSV